MAKCPSCQQKITKADRQSGKCPQCGAALPEILETATPPFDPSKELTQAPLPGEIPDGKSDFHPEKTRPLSSTAAPDVDTRPTEAPRDLGTASPLPAGTASPPVPLPAAEGSDPTDIGTAVPPPPAPEGDDKNFDPNRTVNPRTDAEKTLVELALTASPDATEFAATLNASVTTPLDKPGATLAEGQPPSKSGRKKTGTALEDSLVIQPRDVHRGPGELAAPCDYDVSKLIGEGGMGMVYQARQSSLDRDVALKMIKPRELDDSARARYTANELARVEQTLQRRDREWFLSEAMVTANLEHPYIVPVYDVIKDQKNSLFYAMKWVRGTPWNKLLRDKTEAENLEILMKVADAVAFAHDKGIIHRDLKPENVMVGAHGEVYVMDWGAALVTPDFERSTSLTQSSSGFGSPLYAAPELFLGTVEQIGVRSDVYLLGAVLFEVITGNPPHPYPSSRSEVLSILRSNEIRHTDYKGELLDIAKKAMATNQADRYPNVQELQVAIREYQQHANSRTLSKRARANLVKAEQTGDYTDYQRAVFAYDEAFELWHGNEDAHEGVGQAKLAYAGAALKKGDFDLGLEVADQKDPAHREVIVRLQKAQEERNSRQKRLKKMRRVLGAMAAVMVIGASLLSTWIYLEKVEADKQRGIAETNAAEAIKQTKIAQDNEKEAVKQTGIADDQRTIAQTKQQEAEIAQMKAEKAAEDEKKAKEDEKIARMDADKNAMEAVKQQKIAQANEKKAVAAKAAQDYEAYVAEIGLADSKIKTSAFDDVRRVLTEIRTEDENRRKAAAEPDKVTSLQGWEFARLEYLAGQAAPLVDGTKEEGAQDRRVEALAVDRTGSRFVAGRRDGTAIIGSTMPDDKAPHTIIQTGRPVLAVAISADGNLIATAGEPGKDGSVQLWSTDGKPVGKPFGGAKTVFSVQFGQHKGKTWLLTAGADGSAFVWELGGAAPQLVSPALTGHYGAARSAIFSPDASQIVTVGDDFRTVLWTISDGPNGPAFEMKPAIRFHDSAVLAAAWSPDGRKVVSADEDGRLIVWDPALLAAAKAVGTGTDATKGEKDNRGASAVLSSNLIGHDKAVRAVAFSSDGNFVLSGGDDNAVKLQRLRARGEPGKSDDVKTFRGHGGHVHACVLASLEGKADAGRASLFNGFVLSGGHDSTVMRWNVVAYKEEQVFQDPVLAGTTGPDRDVLSAAFSPDGASVITGSRDHKAYQWDVRTGERRDFDLAPAARRLEEGHALPIWTAAYAPDGSWYLTAGMDDTSLLWDSSTGSQWARLPRTGIPAVVAISPDGKWIATSASESSRHAPGTFSPRVQFWNVAEGVAAGGRLPAMGNRRLAAGTHANQCGCLFARRPPPDHRARRRQRVRRRRLGRSARPGCQPGARRPCAIRGNASGRQGGVHRQRGKAGCVARREEIRCRHDLCDSPLGRRCGPRARSAGDSRRYAERLLAVGGAPG
ncbi:MAG: protein kinase [Planctomycetia bacterium]|nr:protein kinase [Planctomycetia bacterium]